MAEVFRLLFGYSSMDQPSVCGHSYVRSRGTGSFLKPPPPLLISTCHSAVPGWSPLQRPVFNIQMVIREPRELSARTFLRCPGPCPVCHILSI